MLRRVAVGTGAWIIAVVIAACGGSDPVETFPSVTVTPTRDTVTVGQTAAFVAAVDGASTDQIDWTLQEGAAGGSVSSTGEYTAGTTAGTFHLIAASQTTTAADTAAILVVPSPVASFTAPDTVFAGAAGILATVSAAQSGMRYQWTITGGTISGSSTNATVSFTAGAAGVITLGCTVTNLAGTSESSSHEIVVEPPPPAPEIQSWTASRARITSGQTVTLTPTFSAGAGSVNQGIGSVTSGVSLTTGPLTLTTTFTLTVTGTGAPATRSVTVTVVPAPIIGRFDPISRVVATGSSGFLDAIYSADPAGTVSIDPGVGSVPPEASSVVSTGSLSMTTTFTLSVRNSADSLVTDTATVMVQAPAPGAFVSGGTMAMPREWLSATSLPDGRVLILAGAGSPDGSTANVLESAELYSPGSSTFSPGGDQSIVGTHATVLLQDGRVLITGNGTSAELFDPVSGTFTATGDMTETRNGHAMALLPDGRALVVGGGISGETSAELYDPSTGTFSATGAMTQSRIEFMTVPLLDGRVLVIGGRGNGGAFLSTAEAYDPATGTFSQVGSMVQSHWNGTATLLADGRVLIAGGETVGFGVDAPQAEVFDPATNQFTTVGSMALPRWGHTATRRSDGSVLIAGGFNSRIGILSATEVYDPSTDEFRPAASLTQARYRHAAAQTGTAVTIFGGLAPSGLILKTAERFQ